MSFAELCHLKLRVQFMNSNKEFTTGSSSPFEFPSRVNPVPVCTVPSSMDRTNRCNKVDAVRHASYRLNLLLLKGQISS